MTVSAVFGLDAAPRRVVAAWLFGSRARGDHKEDSDVDVAILLREGPEPWWEVAADVSGDLELASGHTADVVVLNQAPADLVHRVLRDGRVLLDRDRAARIAFEVLARQRYFDLLPFYRLYRRVDLGEP